MTYSSILDEVLEDLGYSAELTTDKVRTRVSSYVDRAVFYINNVAGEPVDLNTDLLARQLVIAYCRYANSHCENLFSENYRTDLMELDCTYTGGEDE